MRGRDFKAELTRLGLLTYQVAAEIGLHPSHLSGYLNDKLPMRDSLASKLHAIIARERARQRPVDGQP